MIYRCLDPGKSYDDSKAIQHYEDYEDAKQYLSILSQDPENTPAWEKAGELLYKNPNFYFGTKTSPRADLESMVSSETNRFALFAKKNSSEIYDKLKPEDFAELIQKVPLYKTGDKEHDELADAINEYRKMLEISRDPDKKFSYVQERVNDSKEEWALQSFARFGKNNFEKMFEGYLNFAQAKIISKMFDSNKKLRGEFLKKVFKDSLAEAEKDFKDENYSEGEKTDIWDNNIKSYYVALFEQAYKIEKADENIPENKKDRNERRKERKAKGMPF